MSTSSTRNESSESESTSVPSQNEAFVLLGVKKTEYQTRDRPQKLGPLE